MDHHLGVKESHPVDAWSDRDLGQITMLKYPGVNHLHEVPVFDPLTSWLNVAVKRSSNPLT